MSQARLEEGLKKHGPMLLEADRVCSFTAPTPYAHGGEEGFRDLDEFTISAVLSDDVEEFKRLTRAKDSGAAGLVVPVPRRLGRRGEVGLPRHLAVADARHDCEQTGFWDKPIK